MWTINYYNLPAQLPSLHAEHWCSNIPRLLVSTPDATRHLFEKIGWLRFDFSDNRREQGGLLIGRFFRDDRGIPIQAEITEILEAKTSCRLPGYIEWDAMEEIRLQSIFFELKDTVATTNPALAEELTIIGWWHTHPNELPVFMSSTDMDTQRIKCFKSDKFSLVLNPHRGELNAFLGKDAREVPVVMLRPSCTETENYAASVIAQTHSRNVNNSKNRKKHGKKRNKKRSKKHIKRERM